MGWEGNRVYLFSVQMGVEGQVPVPLLVPIEILFPTRAGTGTCPYG